MAFLKETERSLRIYFIVVGVIGTLLAFAELGSASKASPTAASLLLMVAVWLPPLAHLVLAPAFVVTGIALKRALEDGAPRTRRLIKVAAAVSVVDAVLYAAALKSVGLVRDSAEMLGRAVGHALIPLLILWYIHASLRRLIKESRRRVVDTLGGKFG